MDAHAFLTQALAEWQRRRSHGQEVAPEELCRGRPELLEEARRRIRSLEILERHAQSTFQTEPAQESPEQTLPADVVPPQPELEFWMRLRSLDHLSSGGLGDVYQARDAELGRVVAVKFLKAQHIDDAYSRSQFLLEAEVTGQLDHPGVVPIFGFGLRGSQPFYVMRFLSGGTLHEAISEFHALSHYSLTKLKTLIGHFRSACETLAYAHNRGVVHCDVKPGNILLGRFGETLVADWGSAFLVSRDAQARASGEETLRPSNADVTSTTSSSATRPYTPAYMSPEQIPGSPHPISPASDVYSLGAALYHLLTGRHQLAELYESHKPTKEEIFRWLDSGSVKPPRAIKPEIPPPLEAICLKAMARRPIDRYASALDLARDLEAWRTDSKVSVYRESQVEKLLKSLRRHPQLAAALLLIGLLAFLLTLAGSAYFRFKAASEAQQRQVAEAAKASVEKARVAVLLGSAEWAAGMLAKEIDFRWNVLEALARDRTIKSALTELNSKSFAPTNQPPHAALQQWLTEQHGFYRNLSTSWLVVDAAGRLVARTPPPGSERTFGLSFRYRDYFHGHGADDPSDAEQKRPAIREPYRSIVYRSVSTGELLLTFTVPVFAAEEDEGDAAPLGVLGMSVEVSRFESLQPRGKGSASGLVYNLIDFRTSTLEGRPVDALFVHHHTFADARQRGQLPPELPADVAAHIRAAWAPVLQLPAKTANSDLEPVTSSGQSLVEPLFLSDYRDRSGTAEGAAFAPVIIVNRKSPRQRFTQLVVVAQESTDSQAAASSGR